MTLFGIDILTGIESIAVVYIGFTIVYLLNMFGGAIINCQIAKTETFSLGSFLLSLEKVIFCAITMFGLVVATNLMSQGLFEIDEELSTMVTSMISIAVFALVFAKGFLQKTSALVDKVKYMLEINSTNEIDQTKIDTMSAQSLDDLKYSAEVEPTTTEVG